MSLPAISPYEEPEFGERPSYPPPPHTHTAGGSSSRTNRRADAAASSSSPSRSQHQQQREMMDDDEIEEVGELEEERRRSSSTMHDQIMADVYSSASMASATGMVDHSGPSENEDGGAPIVMRDD